MKTLKPFLRLSFALPRVKAPYRSAAFFATALTGFASLCAQVVWQKYLTILVGSETRSIALVTGIFLTGLALGYWAFGLLTQRRQSRWALLKLYGYVELATAVYIGCFYIYFEFLKFLSFNSPAWLAVDIAISVLALFLPTFLMGASIPVLTACLPESEEEINPLHFKIYGYNTLGAFAGVLLGGFWLLPLFGLQLTLILSAAVNLIAGLVFMGNRLKGAVQRQKSPPVFASSIPNDFYVFSAFVIGALVISFEILFVRLLNLSLGAGVYNFPMILSLFVGALALGSLSVKRSAVSGRFFIRQILATAFLLLLGFWLAPYWGIWISHIRVSLLSLPSNYFVFKGLTYIFLLLAVFPAVFFMGRLLPLAYALLKKSSKSYGALCGRLYFFNTLGTAAGAVLLGYLAFYYLDLDHLFRIKILALIGLGFIAALFEKRGWGALLCLVLAVAGGALPAWDRSGHHLGWFRARQPAPDHFKKLFSLPKKYGSADVLFFKDGPNASVSVLGYKGQELSAPLKALLPPSDYSSVSFVVNGKAIGSSLGDFSTVVLISSLGFLFAPEREEGLSTAVVGLGMGTSAGVLGRLEKVRDVTVLEITPEVVEMVRRAPDFSFGLLSNPKATVIEKDGFKYFTKTDKKFDVIVSEPSNPWVAGVENVFSLEFYELARKALANDGVLVQWAQLYSIDTGSLKIMFRTLSQVFPYARVYQVGWQDIAIVASPQPLPDKVSKDRFFDPFLAPLHKALGFLKPEDLNLSRVFSQSLFSRLAAWEHEGIHTLSAPRLAYRGDKTFFLGRTVTPESLIPAHFAEPSAPLKQKLKAFKAYSSLSDEEINALCAQEVAFFCRIILQALQHYRALEDQANSLPARFASYIYLRKRALAPYDKAFLDQLKAEWLKAKSFHAPNIALYTNQLLGAGRFQQAQDDLQLFQEAGLPEESGAILTEHIDSVKNSSL